MDTMNSDEIAVAQSQVIPSGFSVGKRLQRIRQHFGLSQRELARRAEMTNSTLSMIEQGKVSPSIASLEKILAAIPIPLQSFFAGEFADFPVIIKSAEMLAVDKTGIHHRIFSLGEFNNGKSYFSQLSVDPGATLQTEWLIKKGVVGGFMIEGEVNLTVDGVSHSLNVGDGFHFSLYHSPSLTNIQTQAVAQLVLVAIPV